MSNFEAKILRRLDKTNELLQELVKEIGVLKSTLTNANNNSDYCDKHRAAQILGFNKPRAAADKLRLLRKSGKLSHLINAPGMFKVEEVYAVKRELDAGEILIVTDKNKSKKLVAVRPVSM